MNPVQPLAIACLIGLLILSLEDIKNKKISPIILYSLMVAGIINRLIMWIGDSSGWLEKVIVVGTCLGLLAFSRLSRNHFGMGDAMAFCAIGLVMNVSFLMTHMICSFLLVGLYGIGFLMAKGPKKHLQIPFLPFMTLAFALLMALD